MFNWLKKYIYITVNNNLWDFESRILGQNRTIEAYRKENQSLSGRIKLLEEQHDIMHNFLVEINKYLYNQQESKMGYQSMGDKHGKGKAKSGNNEGRVEKHAEKELKDKKYKNQYKEQRGMK